jgi:hypothetical protein
MTTWAIERTGPREDTGESATWFLCFARHLPHKVQHGFYRWSLYRTAETLARFDTAEEAQQALDNLQGYYDGLTSDLESARVVAFE